jgi:hypothetical protein
MTTARQPRGTRTYPTKPPVRRHVVARGGRYTAADLIEATGITYRQLDYWVREGLLRLANPEQSGSGSTRLFLPEELTVARALAHLSAGGISGPILRAVPPLIRGRGEPIEVDNWTVVVDPPPRLRLPVAPVTLVVRTDLDPELPAAADA